MTHDGPGPMVTRSGWLELVEEERLMRDGYEFLDEKRVVLAAEMLRRSRQFGVDSAAADTRLSAAFEALARAIGRHGVDDLVSAPPRRFERLRSDVSRRNLLGVRLEDGDADLEVSPPDRDPVEPTPELRALAEGFRRTIGALYRRAVAQGSLLRLADEYARTERRARALENVLLPELEAQRHWLGEQLEALDREDVVRVRFGPRSSSGGERSPV